MDYKRPQRGAAMVMALGLLALFASLGVIYVRHMMDEKDLSDYMLRQCRARAVAQAGVNAGIADLRAAVAANQAQGLLAAPQQYNFSAYDSVWNGKALELQENKSRLSQADVTIVDEGGKINLNRAPAPVLAALLNVSPEDAQKMVQSIQGNEKNQGPVQGLGDLVKRGLMKEEQAKAVDASLFTTHTGVDGSQGYLNVNSLSAAALSAIADLPAEAANAVLAKRPFATLDDFRAAVNKNPTEYRMPVDPARLDALPAALSVGSNCFRLVSAATYASQADSKARYNRALARVEAVVRFNTDGTYDILQWSGLPPVE